MWDFLKDTTTMLAVGCLALTGGIAFAGGYGLAKATAPRQQDLDDLQKHYRLARLNNDIQTQRVALNREVMRNQQAANKKKKSVYGLVG